MYSDKKSVQQLVSLLRAYGVRHVVLCPGSRNVPLVQSFSACSDFDCHSVTDERSAGFFAIGLALRVQFPVAVCCTSGSALLNLHPAVCEAFYRGIPLIVISADRPVAWIGQMDGQTLPQPGVFGGLVRKAVNLPEVHGEEDEWYANRLINEALLEVVHHGCGPVHINVPLSEPLFCFTAEKLPVVRRIIRKDMSDEGRTLSFFLHEELPKYRQILIVSGQMTSDEAAGVAVWMPVGRVPWLTEVLGNCPESTGALRGFDAVLYASGEDGLQVLRPDLVITLGGHIVSKRLKQFLRHTPSLVHWHVASDGKPADLFCALTVAVEASSVEFIRLFSRIEGWSSKEYAGLWQESCGRGFQPEIGYSELYAVKRILEALPSYSVLHLANSSSVRLAELFRLPEGVEVQCNRGVNGIEGSVSAAVGYAAVSDRLNFLLVGDLSFFYDMNALWNARDYPHLRIVVLNNGGGAIFHALPGLDMTGDTGRFVAASHNASAAGWAESQGFTYLCATDTVSLLAALDRLVDECASSPVLLEVFTDAETDAAELDNYYREIKVVWAKKNSRQKD
ncbi:MAG: 2-succinyl-5-enolpyruvyl-6-hydroxy-3-cyclohexene-1-carboxylic-acid synthase [Paraprevotella sp.]|nr:2-succinyl-5-enolpyruvyl-6-hydroxy-3-cyclohexene-1-carboxylic-acid synthase [Paraprevotella sp.]